MSELRTARDLTVPGHIEEARVMLHRAIDFGSADDQAAWAKRWGESALDVAHGFSPADHGASDELEELKETVAFAEGRVDEALDFLARAKAALAGEPGAGDLERAQQSLADAIKELEAISL